MKILFCSEDLSLPFDEGIKKTAFHVFDELSKKHDVLALCRYGQKKSNPFSSVIPVKANRLFLNKKIKNIIRQYAPDVVVYLPSSSGTFASFLRLKILTLYAISARSVMINLQPKKLNSFAQKIVQTISPNQILSPSPAVLEEVSFLKSSKDLFPLYVNLEQFAPKSINAKIALRSKYGLPSNKFIISHMGHINWGRNLEALVNLQSDINQVVIVGSSSTPMDAPKEENLKKKLIDSGIIIIDHYIEHIEEIYQLSDLYIFPVEFKGGSIGLPLSLLEARACGIPVLTTEFGSAKKFLGSDNNSVYYAKAADFKKKLAEIKRQIGDYNKTNVFDINLIFKEVLFKSIEG